MHRQLHDIVEDFARLWAVPGFASQFAANLADPPEGRSPGDPHELVLREHHDLLVAALRRAQRRGELTHDGSLDDLADALVGFYLGRRLERGDLEHWASTAITTIIGA